MMTRRVTARDWVYDPAAADGGGGVGDGDVGAGVWGGARSARYLMSSPYWTQVDRGMAICCLFRTGGREMGCE